MNAYMFQIELADKTEEMNLLIPEQRSYINKLFLSGRLIAYSVTQLRNLMWCVVQAPDEQEAMEIIAGAPMQAFYNDISCHPLLFHNTMPVVLPDISLN